jgi:CheY-like chemotaxis protein
MGYRILLADDSLTIQKVVELVFAGSDWELRVAGSGDKAAGILSEFSPDVVLADAVMPGLTGYEFCEAVKRLPDGPYIPVVMLTGTFEPFDRQRADQAGADAVVTKPFDSHALVALVKDLTDRAKEAKAAAPPPPPPPPELEPEPEPEPEMRPSELGEDTAPTDVGRIARDSGAEPPPDAPYATSAMPIPAAAPADMVMPPAEAGGPEPEVSTESSPEPFTDAGAPLPASGVAAPPAYEVDLGGLEEDVARRDIEADIAEFERSGRVSGSVPAFSPVPAEEGADTGPVELPPQGGPLPEPSGSDLELLAARASLGDLTRLVGAGGGGERQLGDDEVERIARRVVEILGERVVRKVAWDVVPEMAERLVRERLRELERTD